MAKKTLTLQIKSSADALQDFKNTFTKVGAGRRVQRREGVYFTSIEAARNLLTRNRVALLRAIRQLRPRSTYVHHNLLIHAGPPVGARSGPTLSERPAGRVVAISPEGDQESLNAEQRHWQNAGKMG